MDQILSALQISFTSEEHEAIHALLGQIEEAKNKVESIPIEEWSKRLTSVAALRTGYSNTLQRGDTALWVEANAFVENQVRQTQLPTWDLICQINALLNQKENDQVVRSTQVYIGPWAASHPDQLNDHIDFLKQKISNIEHLSQNQHPLIVAALIQYWVVSVHPFSDANGRTSILVSDWIHLYFNYFPQVFLVKRDAIVGYFSGRKIEATPARAVLKILNNTLNSYQTFLQ